MAIRISRRVALAGMATMAATGGARAEVGTVRIGIQFGLAYLPAMVAQSEGFIAKRAAELGLPGLQTTITRFSGSTAMNEAMLSNSIDAGVPGTAGALITWDKTRGRQHIKNICSVSATSYTLFTNKPEIKSLKDFGPNDKIAVPAFNSPQAILLRYAAEKEMGDRKIDPLLVYLPHPDATAGLIAGESISGYFATPPFSQVLQKNPKIKTVMTSADLVPGKQLTSTTLVASQGFVDDNPKVAKALFLGFEDACKLIASNPKRAAAIYLEQEKVRLSPEDVEAMLTDGSTRYEVEANGIMVWSKMMLSQRFLTKLPGSWKDTYFPMLDDRQGS